MSVTVLYFASLRDASGVPSEVLARPASLDALYEQLRSRYAFPLVREKVRVAVDGAFCEWTAAVADGAEIAFIPPVSGG